MDNFILIMSDLTQTFFPRLFVSLLCGAMIGIERELKGKSAGLRTCILICLGSTLFSSIAQIVFEQNSSGDPTRIAAQIVSGIGFLGGGVIVHSQGSVYGITTAATIWLTAAIGVAVGMELYPVAIFTSFLCVSVLVGVRLIEEKFTDKFHNNSSVFVIEIISFKQANEIESLYEILNKNNIKMSEVAISKEKHQNTYYIRSKVGQSLLNDLAKEDWVKQISSKVV